MSHIKGRLKQYKDKYSDCYKYDGVYVKVIQDMIEQLQADLEQDEKEKGWTPVSERLPEKHKDVIATVKYNGFLGMYGMRLKTAFIGDYGEWNGECIGGEVIAWMYLPEPYKEG